MFVLVARARQQPLKTLKQWRKRFWIIVESCWHIVRLMPSNLSGCFRQKRAAAKIVSKLLNIEQKQSRMNIDQELLTTFNNDPGLLKQVITSPSWLFPLLVRNPDWMVVMTNYVWMYVHVCCPLTTIVVPIWLGNK